MKLEYINHYPLKNGTLNVATADGPIAVKYHSLSGHFAILPIIVKRDRFTTKDQAAGKKNEKRAYRVTHILSGARAADFSTIGKAQSFCDFANISANEQGVTFDSLPNPKDTRWQEVYKKLRWYLFDSRNGRITKTPVNEFPTKVATS